LNIEKLLRNYRENKGRINILNIERDILLQEKKLPDSVKYIKGPAFSFTPPVQNSFNSIVESANLQLDRAGSTIDKRIEYIDREKLRLAYEIGIVESLITCLDDQEKFIVEKFYFSKLQIYLIQDSYREKFTAISGRHIKNKKKRALQKMANILNFTPNV
jgi:hypothetical protein